MSYILDALRRADAERERGRVPGLHAQPAPVLGADAQATRGMRPWPWLAAVGTVLLIAGGILYLGGGREAAPEPAAASVRAPAPAPAVTLAPVAAPAPVAVLSDVKPPKPKDATGDARVYRVEELPEAIRHELPQMSIGGSMYSESAANRMLIVNGQLLHEGDTAAPDLVLEQIKLKAAVWRYKGYRVQTGF
jgi:general secretion pathway protein B